MHQQIVVTGHQVIGFADERRSEDVLILGIGLIVPLTNTLVSTTALGALLSLIPLLADLFDHLGHETHDLIGIFVGVSLPDLFDGLPEALLSLISPLFDPFASLIANVGLYGLVRFLDHQGLLQE